MREHKMFDEEEDRFPEFEELDEYTYSNMTDMRIPDLEDLISRLKEIQNPEKFVEEYMNATIKQLDYLQGEDEHE